MFKKGDKVCINSEEVSTLLSYCINNPDKYYGKIYTFVEYTGTGAIRLAENLLFWPAKAIIPATNTIAYYLWRRNGFF